MVPPCRVRARTKKTRGRAPVVRNKSRVLAERTCSMFHVKHPSNAGQESPQSPPALPQSVKTRCGHPVVTKVTEPRWRTSPNFVQPCRKTDRERPDTQQGACFVCERRLKRGPWQDQGLPRESMLPRLRQAASLAQWRQEVANHLQASTKERLQRRFSRDSSLWDSALLHGQGFTRRNILQETGEAGRQCDLLSEQQNILAAGVSSGRAKVDGCPVAQYYRTCRFAPTASHRKARR